MKEAVISIHSIHGYDLDEQDTMDFTTDGLYTFKGSSGSLMYYESEVTGLEGTRTTMDFSPAGITVTREGMIESKMDFRPGEQSTFLYDTPFGSAALGIDTRHLDMNFDRRGGKIEIDYVLNMEHAVVARNKFIIDFNELNTTIGEHTYG